MIDNKIIRQVILADKNKEEISINQRKIAANSLIGRSMVMLILFVCVLVLGFAFAPLLSILTIVPLVQSITDFREYQFQVRVISIHDVWYQEYLKMLR